MKDTPCHFCKRMKFIPTRWFTSCGIKIETANRAAYVLTHEKRLITCKDCKKEETK